LFSVRKGWHGQNSTLLGQEKIGGGLSGAMKQGFQSLAVTAFNTFVINLEKTAFQTA